MARLLWQPAAPSVDRGQMARILFVARGAQTSAVCARHPEFRATDPTRATDSTLEPPPFTGGPRGVILTSPPFTGACRERSSGARACAHRRVPFF